jgi:adenine phosphoribosyltransferase
LADLLTSHQVVEKGWSTAEGGSPGDLRSHHIQRASSESSANSPAAAIAASRLAVAIGPGKSLGMDADGRYRIQVGTQEVEVPLVRIAEDLTIALLISVDHGIEFAAQAGQDLSALLEGFGAEIVVSVATMGIPVAIEVTRSLGMNDYVILHKTPKIHLADAVAEPVQSITTASRQQLLLDRARIGAVAGRRVAVVDDVISTGGSTLAAITLLRRVGADPVVVGALVTEGSLWRTTLGDDRQMVQALGSIPLFRHRSDGTLVEDWEGGGGSSPADASASATT